MRKTYQPADGWSICEDHKSASAKLGNLGNLFCAFSLYRLQLHVATNEKADLQLLGRQRTQMSETDNRKQEGRRLSAAAPVDQSRCEASRIRRTLIAFRKQRMSLNRSWLVLGDKPMA